jgi:hypothetical protein
MSAQARRVVLRFDVVKDNRLSVSHQEQKLSIAIRHFTIVQNDDHSELEVLPVSI